MKHKGLETYIKTDTDRAVWQSLKRVALGCAPQWWMDMLVGRAIRRIACKTCDGLEYVPVDWPYGMVRCPDCSEELEDRYSDELAALARSNT